MHSKCQSIGASLGAEALTDTANTKTSNTPTAQHQQATTQVLHALHTKRRRLAAPAQQSNTAHSPARSLAFHTCRAALRFNHKGPAPQLLAAKHDRSLRVSRRSRPHLTSPISYTAAAPQLSAQARSCDRNPDPRPPPALTRLNQAGQPHVTTKSPISHTRPFLSLLEQPWPSRSPSTLGEGDMRPGYDPSARTPYESSAKRRSWMHHAIVEVALACAAHFAVAVNRTQAG